VRHVGRDIPVGRVPRDEPRTGRCARGQPVHPEGPPVLPNVGQLAWIVEKFKELTDPEEGLPEDSIERDRC
jgi:hypothetical protein